MLFFLRWDFETLDKILVLRLALVLGFWRAQAIPGLGVRLVKYLDSLLL